MRGERIFKIAGWGLLGLCAATGFGLVLGYAVMHLWNWLMPGIFGLGEIGYWQAVGLFVLAHLLFKGHHGGPHRCSSHSSHHRSGNSLRDKVHRRFHACADHDASEQVDEDRSDQATNI